MWSFAKIRALGAAILGTLCLCLIVWALGGPGEAYAIARLDALHAVPFDFVDTCYAPGFTHAKYREVAIGDGPDVVRSLIGEPLSVFWGLDDAAIGGRYVDFAPVGGRWVSLSAHDLQIPNGTPMASLDALHARVVVEAWGYSRSCIPDDSRRVRGVTFRHGRVTDRWAGVYYD